MKKDKQNAINDFLKMIENSRTRDRLTDDEKTQFLDFLNYSQMTRDAVKGTFERKQMILCALYHAYLMGCGYNGAYWREK